MFRMPTRTRIRRSGHVWLSCKLEHSREFLRTFAYNFVQTFTQVVEDGAITDFSLVVTLKIIGQEKSMCDFILGAETGHLLAGKVPSIVGDDGVGESEAAHYILSEELDNLLPGDFREWHYLDDPFSEVVSGYQ